MRLVNHASELVHQIYQREKVEDLVNGGMRFSFRHVAAVNKVRNLRTQSNEKNGRTYFRPRK